VGSNFVATKEKLKGSDGKKIVRVFACDKRNSM
jgi:hypothetical protein